MLSTQTMLSHSPSGAGQSSLASLAEEEKYTSLSASFAAMLNAIFENDQFLLHISLEAPQC